MFIHPIKKMSKMTQTEYLVKWKGYKNSETTSEPEENPDCGAEIKYNEKRTNTGNMVTLETPPMAADHQPLTSADLKSGLRVLLRMGGHFHPGQLNEISPPDIYGIVVDKERGNKPHILPREEVLQRVVCDMTPPSLQCLRKGMRVAAYWSSLISFLHPGTVTDSDPNTGYVEIQLDDGDSREIYYKMIRILPSDYPILETEQENIRRRKSKRTEPKEKKRKGANKNEPRGFARGLAAERIIGATKDAGEIFFLIKWKGSGKADIVPAKEANVKIPEMVIEFYEKRLRWHAAK